MPQTAEAGTPPPAETPTTVTAYKGARTPSALSLAYAAAHEAEQRYDEALASVYGADGVARARIGATAYGEPGSELRAAHDARLRALNHLSAMQDDVAGADEWQGYRLRRVVTLDRTEARIR